MNRYQTALYAGTFDPLTKGHLWVINESLKIFQKVIVAVAINPEKKTLFSVDERIEMMQKSVSKNVNVTSFEGVYTVRYAAAVKAGILVRGIRNPNDYGYEQTLEQINRDLEPEIRTIFLMPPANLSHVSSSLIRGMIGPHGWENAVKDYIPSPVYEQLLLKYRS